MRESKAGSDRFVALMDALAEHTETVPDREIVDDATATGIDLKTEGARVRGLLTDALLRAKKQRRHRAGTHELSAAMEAHVPWWPETTVAHKAMLGSAMRSPPEIRQAGMLPQLESFASAAPAIEPLAPPMKPHTVLCLAADPVVTDRLSLDREARAIQMELERSGHRNRFEFVTRWTAEPHDLLRELRQLKPTVVHFSGHGSQQVVGEPPPQWESRPKVLDARECSWDSAQRHGLYFQAHDGRTEFVSTAALDATFGAAGSSVKLVLLNACYSDALAEALVRHVDSVVGMRGSIEGAAARSFAIGFYGALGQHESVDAAYQQGRAAIALVGLCDGDRPQLKVRHGVDASQVVLAADRPAVTTAASAATASTCARLESGIDLVPERHRYTGFVGREDVLARLDEWIDGPRNTGLVVVTGGAGMGKSAILSAWLTRREATGAAVPHHFIRRLVAERDQPEVIAASLAAQIEARYPTLRDPEVGSGRRLLELLDRVSKQLGAIERLVVVVDGIDNACAKPGENPLPRFLPQKVPRGVQFLCATRPTYRHLSWLEACNPVRRLDLDDRRWAKSNAAVIRDFWKSVAPGYEPPLPAETITEAIVRARGNVLHAVVLHDALQCLPANERCSDRIPRGLTALIRDIWDRTASHAAVPVGLGILCAAQEALSLDMLAELAGWVHDDKQHFLRAAQQLLLEEPTSWDGIKAYRPRHGWVRELIAERIGAAAVRTHHATLARTLATWPPRSEAAARRYALRHALIHRVEAGDCASAWQLAADTSFLEARCCELGIYETETDVVQAARRCRANGQDALAQRFDDLAWALARETHWLQAAPEATTALLWNRLRRSRWSANGLERGLRVPAERMNFLRVRRVATRQSSALLRELVGHAGFVNACTVTPDGRRIISASDDRTLKVWDLDSGRLLGTLEGHTGRVTACAVTPDGERVVSASDDRTLKVWDMDSGHTLVTLDGHTDSVTACAVTPDGRRVVSASADQTLKVWDPESGVALATLEGHTRRVNACAVTMDGRCVVSASTDRTLKVWDLESGRALATLEGHAEPVMSCAVTADGRRVVSASWERTMRVWDLNSGLLLSLLEGHTSSVYTCVVTAVGRHVVSASADRTVKLWDLDTSRALVTLEGHVDGVSACAATADGRHVVSASWRDPVLKVWDLESEHATTSRDGHASPVRALVVAADGQRVVSASHDETLKVWDIASGRTLATLERRAGTENACAVTADGRRVVSASRDRTLKVWGLESGRVLSTLEGRARWRNECAVMMAGPRVVLMSDDGTLKVWDLESGRARSTLEGNTRRVIAHVVTPDGRRVVMASEDRTLKICDLESGSSRSTVESHASLITVCAATMDSRRVVSASYDRTLKVWDLDSGRTLATLIGHTFPVTVCTVARDGRRMVSASMDGKLKVWDLDSGRILATLEGHVDEVTACAMTADGRYVVSASEDRTLRVWDLTTYACLLTHRGDAAYTAVAATDHAIVAGDKAGGVWFLDWPPLDQAFAAAG